MRLTGRARKNIWLVVVAALLVSAVFASYGYAVISRIRAIHDVWDHHTQQVVQAGDVLYRLRAALGYGGFIHHFKNYVLRRDEQTAQRLVQLKAEADAAIQAYRQYPLDLHEFHALEQVQSSLDRYWLQFQRLRRNEATDLEPQEMNALAGVDDAQTLQALDYLAMRARDNDQHTHEAAHASIGEALEFISWGALLIPVILLAGGVMVVYLRRLSQANDQIRRTHEEVDFLLDAMPDALLILDVNGMVRRANLAAERLFGYPASQLAGMRIGELLPVVRDTISAHFGTGGPVAGPYPLYLSAVSRRREPETPPIPVEISLNFPEFSGRPQCIASIRDVSEKEYVAKQTRALLQENRSLIRRNLEIQEAERRHLARELHDELGQQVTAIRMDAELIRHACQGPQPDAPGAVEYAEDIQRIATNLVRTMRSITNWLRPANLDYLGLRDTLLEFVTNWQRRHPGIDVSLEMQGDLEDLGEVVNISLFRVLQESLTNVDKHARASQVRIVLHREGFALRLEISDDGVGWRSTTGVGGMGLLGMRERCEALNGSFDICGNEPQGTSIRVNLPLDAAGPELAEERAVAAPQEARRESSTP